MRQTNSPYIRSHGKQPRGKGLWAFEITGETPEGQKATETIFKYGTVNVARNLANKEFRIGNRSEGYKVTEIKTLP